MILDTNALSAFAEGDEGLASQLEAAQELYLPVVVLGEYRFGVRQSRHRKAYEDWLHAALSDLAVLPILDSTTEHYAALCHELRRAGTPPSHQRCLDRRVEPGVPSASGQSGRPLRRGARPGPYRLVAPRVPAAFPSGPQPDGAP